ncbi:MAG: 2OG-Fe(II) oxygenase family protein [Patescibacteria group bacterium]
MKSNLSSLKNQGFVNLPYPNDLRNAVNSTVTSWKNFCSLPIKAKTDLPYSNNTAGVGYELKEGKGPKGDRKENFDITTAGTEWLTKHAKQIGNGPALEFITQATELIETMKPYIFEFAEKVEKNFALKGFADEVRKSENAFFVRFIHYFGDRKLEDETASAHTDQSGFTLHLFESDPGLQCLSYDKKWIDMPVSEGETVIIPAMQLQYRSNGELKALCHRVIANTKTAENGRYSAVCFIQLSDTPKYDKEKHGRLQEKVAGFNYDMPFTEFSKLFK